jgi:[acyl-carrier-protein] S-malonyltransferase
MLAEHFVTSKVFSNVFEISKEVIGTDFKKLIEEGTTEDLAATQVTQPLLLTANYALWQAANIDPKSVDIMAGHSLGEYSAYVAAEAIKFEDALELVSLRAKYMQEAVKEGEGGIAAIIGLDTENLETICRNITEYGDLVSMANLNSDNQIVISGTKTGVDKAIVSCKENGAKRAIPLAMSVPSHCKLMTPASIKFSEDLNKVEFLEPKTKVIQNFSVMHSDDVDIIKENLISQLYSPVRWSETMHLFKENNITEFYECGPSKVLTGLIKKQFTDIALHSLDDIETLTSIQEN